MDWINFDQGLPHSQTLSPPRVTPSSPSSDPVDGPGFVLRRLRAARPTVQAAPSLPLMPPALRFPAPATFWTA